MVRSEDAAALEMTYALIWAENTASYSLIQCFSGLLIQIFLIFISFTNIAITIEAISLNTRLFTQLIYLIFLVFSALMGFAQSAVRHYETTHKTKKVANRGMNLHNYDFSFGFIRSYWFTFTSQFNGLVGILFLFGPLLFVFIFAYTTAFLLFPLPIMIFALADYLFWKKYFLVKIKNKPGFKIYLDIKQKLPDD